MITLTFVMKQETWWKFVRKFLMENGPDFDYDSWEFKYGIDRMEVIKLDVAEEDAIEITRSINDILAERGES